MMELWNQKQVARYLKVASKTIRRWRLKGKFPEPIIDVEGRPLWSRSQVLDFIRSEPTGRHARDFN